MNNKSPKEKKGKSKSIKKSKANDKENPKEKPNPGMGFGKKVGERVHCFRLRSSISSVWPRRSSQRRRNCFSRSWLMPLFSQSTMCPKHSHL